VLASGSVVGAAMPRPVRVAMEMKRWVSFIVGVVCDGGMLGCGSVGLSGGVEKGRCVGGGGGYIGVCSGLYRVIRHVYTEPCQVLW
jgi:hypothetical protein